MNSLTYTADQKLTIEQFIDVLNRSTLGERRPVADRERIASMLQHANLLCTAWDGDLLVGVARSVTDFSFCCYLSDLAVDAAYQDPFHSKKVTSRRLRFFWASFCPCASDARSRQIDSPLRD